MKRVFIAFLILVTIVSCKKETELQKNELWYDEPAEEWMQALPVGNGRFGAMVFGDPNNERIQLNEDSMWSGAEDWKEAIGTPEDLEEIRALLLEGKNQEVDSLIVEKFSYKTITRSHQTMGDLFIDFKDNKNVENYKRSLNLNDALLSVAYTSQGDSYTQKVIASHPDDVLVIELATTAENGMDFDLRLDRPKDTDRPTVVVTNPSETEISMKGVVTQFGGKRFSAPFPLDYGVKFETRLKVKNESGSVSSEDGKLQLKGVKKATIYLAGNTSFYHGQNYVDKNIETLASATKKTFEQLLQSHTKDYRQLYNRVAFDLGGKTLDSLPTDTRLQRRKDGLGDPDLAAKLFQYGRYLLIASSRPGTNPANLQGIWNEHITAPWNADYHININLQMNYWPAEVTNLSELHDPFFSLLDRVYENGKVTAKEQYGITRGTMAHHTTDLWATPFMRAERAYWGSWIHGGGWCAQHYWERYQFTQDEVFLKERAYPILKGLSEFYLDWLVWDEKSGKWVSTPETSPENSYIAKNGQSAAVSFGSAMGHQIIGEVFDNTLAAAQILGIDDAFTKEVTEKREQLHPGILIGDDGRILEWNEPYDEPEKGHRHMSHLYALHPGDEIVENNAEAFDAAQKTIDYRLQHGGAGTGWSRAWMINMNARLLDGAAAQENIDKFLQISIAHNMFDEHPPFQIDGNFGYTAGVAELLLQSHEGFLRILPALPTKWKNGKISGLKARGNIEIDIEWKDGKLLELGLKAAAAKTVQIKYGDIQTEVSLPANSKIVLGENLDKI
ncbi:glycosyl hydrolase family 95 catalytic domain-containing protein [Flagellimonas myxillae]|uniref:glycoside hydrolase family 95 protein n=1 Tax=Flagellimonas myxillae TaxID=2942214 RepID=UPI00201EEBC2|nr:glycoside hydrolase N-terminal domain-containing protein [Muricauda myxillae]MCL6267104.1 glycoside hydrolase family 95 protein [Muricauda myxillae]